MKSHKVYLLFLALLLLLSIGVVIISPFRYSDIVGAPFLKPCHAHILGTDSIGRDLLVRLGFSVILSIFIAVLSVVFSVGIGSVYGSFAGYKGGKAQALMTSFIDVIESVPDFLYAILLMVLLNTLLSSRSFGSVLGLLCAIAITSWTQMARIVKNSTAALMRENYILYAQMKNAGFYHIAAIHLFPNMKEVIISTVLQRIPSAIFLESFLSFLGIGIQPPLPSLGRLISEGLTSYRTLPIHIFAPSLALALVIILFNLAGDAYMRREG